MAKKDIKDFNVNGNAPGTGRGPSNTGKYFKNVEKDLQTQHGKQWQLKHRRSEKDLDQKTAKNLAKLSPQKGTRAPLGGDSRAKKK